MSRFSLDPHLSEDRGDYEPAGDSLDFGDYCYIEQKRYGVPNEIFSHKAVQRLRSNTWVDVPVQTPAQAVIHTGEMEECVRAITCGACKERAYSYRLKDLCPR